MFVNLGLLPRMILLWRNAFPRNIKELDSEKARGDAFTWKVSLEGRAGALSAMHSFIEVNNEINYICFTKKLIKHSPTNARNIKNVYFVFRTALIW